MFITFSSIAVNTCLSENSHQAIRFHFQIFNQLERLRGQSDLLQRNPSSATGSLIVWIKVYLPDGVKLCSFWYGVLPWFVLDDLVVVHIFPIHHRQGKSTRLLSFSHSEKSKNKATKASKSHRNLWLSEVYWDRKKGRCIKTSPWATYRNLPSGCTPQ